MGPKCNHGAKEAKQVLTSSVSSQGLTLAWRRNGKLMAEKAFQLTDVEIGNSMARRMMKLPLKKLGSSRGATNIFETQLIEQ